MKKNFKKSLAVFMTVLMLLSAVSVSAFAATYTITYSPGSYANEKDLTKVVTVNGAQTITLEGAMYTREGYYQAGWSTAKSGTSKSEDLGASYKVTRTRPLYPYWKPMEYTVSFNPGANGVGEPENVTVAYNKTTKFPGEIFTREGYLLVGWSTVDGGDLEYQLKATTPKVTGDITYYPVWEKCDYTVETTSGDLNLGSVCVDYSVLNSEIFTITNKGNMTLTYSLPENSFYDISVSSGTLAVKPGQSVSINVKPKIGLDVGDYTEVLLVDCDYDQADVYFNVTFLVSAHSFDRYVSDNNATYEADGTKSAECSNGCGCIDIIIDLGSMKRYSADNNTVDGLLNEYLYHKTIHVTAYGSGTDNIQEDGTIAEGTKRFLPVSWYVNEEFNGEFKDENFDINFVHTSFGKYTLKISYVEQEYVNGEWVDTGVEDEKSFDYYVGPSEKEEQEVVRPNTIVNIIFGLFAKLAELLSAFFA